MAVAWPDHEWSILTNKPVLFVNGRKYITNKSFEKDGVKGAYLYCRNRTMVSCKASAKGVYLEGKIKIII
jgi:hypothetical protein